MGVLEQKGSPGVWAASRGSQRWKQVTYGWGNHASFGALSHTFLSSCSPMLKMSCTPHPMQPPPALAGGLPLRSQTAFPTTSHNTGLSGCDSLQNLLHVCRALIWSRLCSLLIQGAHLQGHLLQEVPSCCNQMRSGTFRVVWPHMAGDSCCNQMGFSLA